MTQEVVITGAGLVGALGSSATDVLQGIGRGESGIHPAEAFSAQDSPPRDLPDDTDVPRYYAAEIRDLDPSHDLGDGNLRPLDRTGQLAAIGCARTLANAQWTRTTESFGGLVLGTQYGGLRTIAEFDRRGICAGPLYVKPFEFANSVINAAAGQAAIWHHLEGPNTTVSAGLASGVQALGYARDLIRLGHANRLLAGGAEEFCFETQMAFDRAGRINRSGILSTFDPSSEGTVLGEGAGFVALETSSSAKERGAIPQGYLLGYGEAFDSSRGRDSNCGVEALSRAIAVALRDAGIDGSKISLIATAANGCNDLDDREAAACSALLGANPLQLPTLQVKRHLGECLGASGGHQIVLLLEALEPGTVGLVNGASFDGHHAALILKKAL